MQKRISLENHHSRFEHKYLAPKCQISLRETRTILLDVEELNLTTSSASGSPESIDRNIKSKTSFPANKVTPLLRKPRIAGYTMNKQLCESLVDNSSEKSVYDTILSLPVQVNEQAGDQVFVEGELFETTVHWHLALPCKHNPETSCYEAQVSLAEGS